MASFIQFRRSKRSSASTGYMQLLSTLANDLDHMLSVLCTTPPPPYDRLTDNEIHNRQTTGGVDSNGRASISHTGTIVDNNRHHLIGSASASKQFRPNGPLTVGGTLDYTHKPSGSTLGVGASNTRGFGTDVSATGRYNFYNKGGTSVFAEGNYGRHFGGPGGTGRPNYYGGVGVSHRW